MNCKFCGKPIIFKKGYKKKYCSNKCKNRHWYLISKYSYLNRAKIKLNKICPICGKHFVAKNIRRICCYGIPFKNTCYNKLRTLQKEGLI
jgi:hypothetical protein